MFGLSVQNIEQSAELLNARARRNPQVELDTYGTMTFHHNFTNFHS